MALKERGLNSVNLRVPLAALPEIHRTCVPLIQRSQYRYNKIFTILKYDINNISPGYQR
jgi:hypothetical protein